MFFCLQLKYLTLNPSTFAFLNPKAKQKKKEKKEKKKRRRRRSPRIWKRQ
jgi:hypothetical protein